MDYRRLTARGSMNDKLANNLSIKILSHNKQKGLEIKHTIYMQSKSLVYYLILGFESFTHSSVLKTTSTITLVQYVIVST